MQLKVRGRHTGKDIFKPGERCQIGGRYRCENCKNRGQETLIEAAEGSIFPLCAQCTDWDMGWRLLDAPSRR
jgi:hypothetical protein